MLPSAVCADAVVSAHASKHTAIPDRAAAVVPQMPLVQENRHHAAGLCTNSYVMHVLALTGLLRIVPAAMICVTTHVTTARSM
jgi:hypothetical protein